jgi:hypothetical protein
MEEARGDAGLTTRRLELQNRFYDCLLVAFKRNGEPMVNDQSADGTRLAMIEREERS